MKSVSALAAITALLVCSTGAAVAQNKAVKEQNDHARKVQQTNDAKRTQTNNSVNQHAQQQRNNAPRPTTPLPSGSNNRRK